MIWIGWLIIVHRYRDNVCVCVCVSIIFLSLSPLLRFGVPLQRGVVQKGEVLDTPGGRGWVLERVCMCWWGWGGLEGGWPVLKPPAPL